MLKAMLNYWTEKIPYGSYASAQVFLGISSNAKTTLAAAGGNPCGCSGECECSGPCDGGCGSGDPD